MKPAAFDYYAPVSLPDALRILSDIAPDDGRILAGGQSLVPTMALRMAKPKHLLDINRIRELGTVQEHDGWLTVGATVRHATFQRRVTSNPLGGLMQTVVRNIAHYAIRTRGTLCGSLALADPASEWCCTARTLGAEIVVDSVRGRRIIPANDFLEGIMSTALAADEMIVAVRLPLLPDDTRYAFLEFSRRHGDFALSMVLVTLRLVDGRLADVHIGVGAAEETARRMSAGEAMLDGQAPSDALLQAAARAAAASLDPMSDETTSADYRRELAETLILRALQQALS